MLLRNSEALALLLRVIHRTIRANSQDIQSNVTSLLVRHAEFKIFNVITHSAREDYTKTTERISTKLEWRMCSGQNRPLTFGADVDKATDPGNSFLLSLTVQAFRSFH